MNPLVSDPQNTHPTRRPFWPLARRFAALVPARLRWGLVLTLGLTVVTGATVNAVPILLGWLVNAMRASQLRGTLAAEWAGLAAAYLGVILAVFLGREALQMVRKYLVRSACTRLEKDLTVEGLGRVLRADLSLYSAQQVGALRARLQSGVEGAVGLVKLGLQDMAPALFTVVPAIAYALYAHVEIGLVMLAGAASTLLLAAWQTRVQKKARIEALHAEEALGGALVEQLNGLEYLRAANAHDREVERLARFAEERKRKELEQQVRGTLFDALKGINDWALQVAVVACAVLLTLSGRAGLGSTLTFWYLCFNVLTPLRDIYRNWDEAQSSYLHAQELHDLLSEPLDRSFAPAAAAGPHLGDGLPLFEAEGLVVDYVTPSGQTKRALDGVSVRIDCGEVVGIAGRSGSGKSTLVKALLRLVHPSAGQALLGGVALEDVPRDALARLAGYVGQEPFLFSGTMAENIAYGRPDATPEEVRRAARLVGLHREIVRLPGGYQAQVGERGRSLSGGQRQRLALARALLSGPPVLVLDEATSALDPASERRALRALARGRGERTVLLVAHRPAALRAADRVLVFDSGRLVEEGTYRDLLRQGGTFAEVFRSSRRRAVAAAV